MKKIVNAYFPPIVWAVIIFIFSSQTALPGFDQSVIDFVFKKLAHIIVYLILYLLVLRALNNTISNKKSKAILVLPIAICLVYAITDELHQSIVPGRFATIRDIGYDMIGVGIAMFKKFDYI